MNSFRFCGILLFLAVSICYTQADAQWLKKIGKSIENKAKEKVESTVDKTMDNVLNGENSETEQPDVNTQKSNTIASKSSVNQGDGLQTFTEYTFVPGDKILYYEDFSQDAIGDFPAMWTTNGSGEVRKINKYPGNWFCLNSGGKTYVLMKELELPENFIVEFDLLSKQKGDSTWTDLHFSLSNPENTDLGYVPNYPLTENNTLTIQLEPIRESWETSFYADNSTSTQGSSKISPLSSNELEHIIVWVQKRRLRVFSDGKKVLDMPTLIPANFTPNRLLFYNDEQGENYVSNIRITTASPDTRNKLLTEGKIVSYGIYFDTNSASVKPESNGTIADMAKVIKEAGNVKVKIVGHTDNVGDDKSNLDLSLRRANAVKTELEKQGVTASNLITEGAGENSPIASNDTPENRALNRRVEFIKVE